MARILVVLFLSLLTLNADPVSAAKYTDRATCEFVWLLDSINTFSTADACGNGRTGTVGTGVSTVTGVFGNGFDLDGTESGEVYIDPGASLYGVTQNVSVVIWYESDNTDNYVKMFGKMHDQNHSPYVAIMIEFSGSSDKVSFKVTNDSESDAGATSTTGISTSGFDHVCGTYDGSEVAMVYNGVEEGTGAQTGNVDNPDQEFNLGQNLFYSPQNYNGIADEAGYFSETFTTTECNEIMDNGLDTDIAAGDRRIIFF